MSKMTYWELRYEELYPQELIRKKRYMDEYGQGFSIFYFLIILICFPPFSVPVAILYWANCQRKYKTRTHDEVMLIIDYESQSGDYVKIPLSNSELVNRLYQIRDNQFWCIDQEKINALNSLNCVDKNYGTHYYYGVGHMWFALHEPNTSTFKPVF